MGAPTVFSRAAFYFDIQACSTVPKVFPTVLSQVFAPPCPRYFQQYFHKYLLHCAQGISNSTFTSICCCSTVPKVFPTVLSQVFAPPCLRYFQPYLSFQSVKDMFSGIHFSFLKTSYTQSIFYSICSTESIVQILKILYFAPLCLEQKGKQKSMNLYRTERVDRQRCVWRNVPTFKPFVTKENLQL